MVRKPSPPRKPRKLTSAPTPSAASPQAAGGAQGLNQDSIPTAELASSGPIELAGESLSLFDTGSVPRVRHGGSGPAAGTSRPGRSRGAGPSSNGILAAMTPELFDENAPVNIGGGGSHVSVRPDSRSRKKAGTGSGSAYAPAEDSRDEDDAFGLDREQTGRGPLARLRARRTARDDISARRAEKRAERRRFLSMRIGAIAALVIVGFGLAYAVFFSPLFALHTSKIEVRLPEKTTVSAEAVVAALEGNRGTSIFMLSPSKLSAQVEASVARTGDVKVDRVLPHGLRVSFVDRSPIACLVKGEACAAIDEIGREVEATPEEMDGLLRIVYAGEEGKAGAYAMDILSILSALPEELSAMAVQAEVAEEGQITLVFSNGQIVRWGMPGDTELKVQVLGVIMKEAAPLYDVSEPHSPISGPSPAAAQGEAAEPAQAEPPEAAPAQDQPAQEEQAQAEPAEPAPAEAEPAA